VDQITTLKTREMTIGDAVRNGIVANETLGFFIARTYLFLIACGIKKDRLRFRQHLKDEMAHYATDCWDAEIENSYGWIECVGIADRSCFDLNAHSAVTNAQLSAFVEFPKGQEKTLATISLVLNKSLIGKTFSQKSQAIIKYLEGLDVAQGTNLNNVLKSNGRAKILVNKEDFEITKEMIVDFKFGEKKVTGEQIVPAVIEPSFGIGRILYSLLEHAFYTREGTEARTVLSLPPAIAPVKVSVLPLIDSPKLNAFIPILTSILNDLGISHKVDDIGHTVGRRYARTDEIGIPFGITIDFDNTVDKNSVTIRERDSTFQILVKIDEVGSLLKRLVDGKTTWEDVWKNFPHIVNAETDTN